MIRGIKSVIYPVKDLAQATVLYSKFVGAKPYFDEPYYVGFKLGEHEIGLDPNGHAEGMIGPVCYWQVDDIKAGLASFLNSGATAYKDPKDVGGGMLMAAVKDPDGNTVGLIQLP